MSLLQKTPAVQALEQGCDELGLAKELAVELVRFLTVKRWHGLLPETERGMGLSPGAAVDELWHWVLLNTEVAELVDAHIGGKVHHSTRGTTSGADETPKMLRRMKAMTLMQREGWTPQLQFWQEHGSLMDGLTQRTVRVSGHGSVLLWASAHTTAAQLTQLARDILTTAAPDARAAPQESRATKMPRRRSTRSSDAVVISVLIKRLTGEDFSIKANTADTIGDLKAAVQGMKGVPTDQQRMIFGGVQLDDDATLGECGVSDGAVVHMLRRLTGC